MARLTSLILLGAGALVLVTWLVAPATSSPQVPRVATPTPPPDLVQINQELDRLQSRLAPPARPVIVRDPFQFAASSRSSDAAPGRAVDNDDDTQAVPPQPAVSWPRLVAILTSGAEPARDVRAVFEDRHGIIQILNAGDTIDDVRVDRITAEDVLLATMTGDQTTRLALR